VCTSFVEVVFMEPYRDKKLSVSLCVSCAASTDNVCSVETSE
jgi:hypothetical protein